METAARRDQCTSTEPLTCLSSIISVSTQKPATDRKIIARILKPLKRAKLYNITITQTKKAAARVRGSPTETNQFAFAEMRSNIRSINRIVTENPGINIHDFLNFRSINVRNNHADIIDTSA
jgi:hypothetical protein